MNQPLALQLNPESQAVMACVDAFENSQNEGDSDLRSFLSSVPQEYRQSALAELIRVDYERHWKRGQWRPMEQYLQQYPELCDSEDTVLKLLHEEFEFRLKIGQQPSVDEYRKILPRFSAPSRESIKDQSAEPTQTFAAAPTTPVETQPQQIGKYRIVRVLGKGGFGVVYQGYDAQLERHVAIKVTRAPNKQPGLEEGLLHEARSIASLDHSGIVKLLEAGETDAGEGYVVYEYVAGETLHERIRKADYDFAQAAQWTAEVADALHYAHTKGIVHRDVKPANVLIDPAGRARVFDFGLARRNDKFYVDDRGRVLGTLSYLSPEQGRGDSHWASAQSDIYSLGAVLYEMLCGRVPFQAKTSQELLEQVEHRAPSPPRSINDAIPPALEDICLKSLSKQPQQRYNTGADMAAALRSAVRPHASRWIKVAQAAAALVAMAAVAVLAVTMLGSKAPIVPPTQPLDITNFNLYLPNFSPITRDNLPLTSDKHLEIQVPLNQPAFAYLLMYENQGVGKLLWPRDGSGLNNQHKTNVFTYPPANDPNAVLAVPDSDGASLIVVLVSARELNQADLDKLLEAPLDLHLTPEESVRLKVAFDFVDRTPKARTDFPLRGEGPGGRPSVADEFKQMLRGSTADQRTFYGMILPHIKQTSAGN